MPYDGRVMYQMREDGLTDGEKIAAGLFEVAQAIRDAFGANSDVTPSFLEGIGIQLGMGAQGSFAREVLPDTLGSIASAIERLADAQSDL